MKKLLILFSCIAMLFLTTGIAWAAIIDFEDLDDGYAFDMTKPAYEGFIWWNYTVVEVPEGSGYEDLVNSGTKGLLGGGAIPYMFYADTSSATASLFDFNGVWLSTPGEVFNSIIVTGLDEGSNILFSTTIDDLTSESTYYAFNWSGLAAVTFAMTWSEDPLVISSFIMDDFDYEVSAVPEPATMLLLGTGLVGLAGFRRKMFKQR